MIYTKQELLSRFVEIAVKNDDEFLIIRETLTRIGIPNGNELQQQCHIFHKQGRYFIVHYTHMLAFNGENIDLHPESWATARDIAAMLVGWNLTTLVKYREHLGPSIPLTVVQSKDRRNWTLRPMYRIGNR